MMEPWQQCGISLEEDETQRRLHGSVVLFIVYFDNRATQLSTTFF